MLHVKKGDFHFGFNENEKKELKEESIWYQNQRCKSFFAKRVINLLKAVFSQQI